jgi:hypothetical protein
MAALLLAEAPNIIVRQWYDNISTEFKLYCRHYYKFADNWGCCGRSKHNGDADKCGKLPVFALTINDTLFTDQYVPSVMPVVAVNYRHLIMFNADLCKQDCSECCDFRHDYNEFYNAIHNLSHYELQAFRFDTNAELEVHISALIYKLSQSNFRHYALNIKVLMHNTLKKFYQLLFVSGRHTKAARR